MLLTIRAWNDKKKQFFFKPKELEDYVKSQNTSIKKYKMDKKYQSDQKYLEQMNIVLTGDDVQDNHSISNVIFEVIEKNLLKKLNIEPPKNLLIKCSKCDKNYMMVKGFYELIKVILKKKSLTAHIEPTEHYVIFLMSCVDRSSTSTLKYLHITKSFEMPIKCDNSLLYYVYSGIVGNLTKIDNQEKYNDSFITNKEVIYLYNFISRYTAIVKGKCFNNDKSVLEIDKILFILQYIDNEFNVYLESLPVSDVFKEYLFAVCKSHYYHMSLIFLCQYILDISSVKQYKSLSDIRYKY